MRILLPVAVAVVLASCRGADDSAEAANTVTIGVDPLLAYAMALATGIAGWVARGKWDEKKPPPVRRDGEEGQ